MTCFPPTRQPTTFATTNAHTARLGRRGAHIEEPVVGSFRHARVLEDERSILNQRVEALLQSNRGSAVHEGMTRGWWRTAAD